MVSSKRRLGSKIHIHYQIATTNDQNNHQEMQFQPQIYILQTFLLRKTQRIMCTTGKENIKFLQS